MRPIPAPLHLMTVDIWTILKNYFSFSCALDKGSPKRTWHSVLMWISELRLKNPQLMDTSTGFSPKGLIKWPSTTIGPVESPYHHTPNTVSIIDGNELFYSEAKHLSTQKSSYSEYKSHTTVKFLMSIDPFTGLFSFVSTGFSGNSSDRFVVDSAFWLIVVLQQGISLHGKVHS